MEEKNLLNEVFFIIDNNILDILKSHRNNPFRGFDVQTLKEVSIEADTGGAKEKNLLETLSKTVSAPSDCQFGFEGDPTAGGFGEGRLASAEELLTVNVYEEQLGHTDARIIAYIKHFHLRRAILITNDKKLKKKAEIEGVNVLALSANGLLDWKRVREFILDFDIPRINDHLKNHSSI